MQRMVIKKTGRKIVARVTVLFVLFLLLFGAISMVALWRVLNAQDERALLMSLQEEIVYQERALQEEREMEDVWNEEDDDESFESDHEKDEHDELPRMSRRELVRSSLYFRYERDEQLKWGSGFERLANIHVPIQAVLVDWLPELPAIQRVTISVKMDEQVEDVTYLVAAAPYSEGWLYIGSETGAATELWNSALWWLGVVVCSFGILGGGLAWWLTGRSMRPVAEAMNRQAQFVTNASHEFRTPLSIMKTSLDCLSEEPVMLESSSSAKWIHQLEDEVDRMTLMIDRLLTMARMEQGKSMVVEQIDVPATIEHAIGRMRFRATEQHVSLAAEGGALLMWDCDRILIEQLLTIMLDNAIGHSPVGGVVTCRWLIQSNERKNKKWLRIEVQDQGEGIPEDQLPYLFDRFYRGDEARTSRNGLGVGLSIAQAIAHLHQGEIGVESVMGQGSTFWIHFPARTTSSFEG